MKFSPQKCQSLNFPLVLLLSSLFLGSNSLRDDTFSVELNSDSGRNFERNSRESKDGWPWDFDDPTLVSNEHKPTSVQSDNRRQGKMGVLSTDCDDGKTDLEMDWNGSPVNYTCFHPESLYPTDTRRPPVLECVTLSKGYMPKHFCMTEPIVYDDPIPTYGDHRPIWPIYGEYQFVPAQRWLHNVEHGAIVMLFHPCAHPEDVEHLRRLVRECFGKHVITPSTFIPKERPLVLVAWGCKYLMSSINEVEVRKFIHEKSMKGPEGPYTKEGAYDFGLIRAANDTVGTRYDQITCDMARRK